jgi:hypothetical protein
MTHTKHHTYRQIQVLRYVQLAGVVSTGSDGSVLHSLWRKGYVNRNEFHQGQNKYYTWSMAPEGERLLVILKGCFRNQ